MDLTQFYGRAVSSIMDDDSKATVIVLQEWYRQRTVGVARGQYSSVREIKKGWLVT